MADLSTTGTATVPPGVVDLEVGLAQRGLPPATVLQARH